MRLHHLQSAIVICPDLDVAADAYSQSLHQTIIERGTLSDARAQALGDLALSGRRFASIGIGADAPPWLELIERVDAQPSTAFTRFGWLALEVLVADVDALALTLNAEHFRVLEAPKDLDLSDAIRAMQVQGPAGEVLYLTEVKRPLAPFTLPLSTHLSTPVGAPFVAVLACKSRAESSAFYLGLGGISALTFSGRLSALNRVHGLALEQKHPMATVQLAGAALLEMDELTLALAPAADSAVSGIYAVCLARIGTRGQAGPARWLRGPDGELLGLV
jgi:hypothetical protein